MAPVPSFLGDFSDGDIAWVIENGIQQNVRAGTDLITEGEVPDAVWVILDGTFVVCSEALGISFLSRLGRGELAGEMSYVRGVPPIGTVRAESDAVVLEIPRVRLDAKIAQDEGFSGRFHRVVSEFTIERMHGFKKRYTHGATPPEAPEAQGDEALENLRVYELIEKMLRGDFPEN